MQPLYETLPALPIDRLGKLSWPSLIRDSSYLASDIILWYFISLNYSCGKYNYYCSYISIEMIQMKKSNDDEFRIWDYHPFLYNVASPPLLLNWTLYASLFQCLYLRRLSLVLSLSLCRGSRPSLSVFPTRVSVVPSVFSPLLTSPLSSLSHSHSLPLSLSLSLSLSLFLAFSLILSLFHLLSGSLSRLSVPLYTRQLHRPTTTLFAKGASWETLAHCQRDEGWTPLACH